MNSSARQQVFSYTGVGDSLPSNVEVVAGGLRVFPLEPHGVGYYDEYNVMTTVLVVPFSGGEGCHMESYWSVAT